MGIIWSKYNISNSKIKKIKKFFSLRMNTAELSSPKLMYIKYNISKYSLKSVHIFVKRHIQTIFWNSCHYRTANLQSKNGNSTSAWNVSNYKEYFISNKVKTLGYFFLKVIWNCIRSQITRQLMRLHFWG